MFRVFPACVDLSNGQCPIHYYFKNIGIPLLQNRYIYMLYYARNTTRKMLECMYVFAWAFSRIYATEVVVLHCGAQ